MDKLRARGDGQLEESGRPLRGDVLARLGMAVDLAQEFRLGSWFEMLVHQPELARLSPFLPGLLEQYARWPKVDGPPLGLDHLELSKVVELIGFPGPARVEIYADVRGVFQGEDVVVKAFPVETLLGAALRLGPLKHRIFGDRFDQMAVPTVFSLFDLVDGIAWQLAFHGSPTECALRR